MSEFRWKCWHYYLSLCRLICGWNLACFCCNCWNAGHDSYHLQIYSLCNTNVPVWNSDWGLEKRIRDKIPSRQNPLNWNWVCTNIILSDFYLKVFCLALQNYEGDFVRVCKFTWIWANGFLSRGDFVQISWERYKSRRHQGDSKHYLPGVRWRPLEPFCTNNCLKLPDKNIYWNFVGVKNL